MTVSGLVAVAAVTALIMPQQPGAADMPLLVQGGDCYAIGEAVAAQNGGTLASANDAQQNGTPVCQVIIVVPAKEGERPKRMEIIVPKG